MNPEQVSSWSLSFEKRLLQQPPTDSGHDLAHIRRVVANALHLAAAECASLDVVLPSAWLHDLVNLQKDDPRRSEASRLAAEEAVNFLREIGYPGEFLPDIAHAIEAHSFSANIEPRTLEAKVVQDADRLDALGAIGIARCFATSSAMRQAFYCEADPFAENRQLDDTKYALDHFEIKLFPVVASLKTEAGRREGRKRALFLYDFLTQFKSELGFAAH